MLRALVFADRLGAELLPLTETLSVPLLPVVGKELLIYTIEELVSAGCRELVVVVAAHGDQRGATSLGDGTRWGIAIRYVLSQGEEMPSAIRRRLSLPDRDALLALRGDVLRTQGIGPLLERAQGETGTFVLCSPEDPRGSLLLIRPGCREAEALLDLLDWRRSAPLPDTQGFAMEGFRCYPLEDPAGFHRANLDLLAGRLSGWTPGGRTVALGLTADRGAQVSPRSLKQGKAFVGANTRVHPEAELLGEVVIGADAIVDRGATIRDSVILPGTYVGELLDIGNAIVAGNRLLRVDTGARLKLSEAFLLGDLATQARRSSRSRWDQVAGLILLLLSLPLWPIAMAAASLSGQGALLDRRVLIGNRSTAPTPDRPAGGFVDRVWTTPIPLLRHLPRVLAVIRGDLRLVGVSPLTPEEEAGRDEDWQRVRDGAPVGLLGPTQLNLGDAAPLEERLLSDAFYARDQGPASTLRLLLGAVARVFGRGAWQASPSPASE